MLLVPLATGAAIALHTGGHFPPVVVLTIAVLALFWLRTPAESWLGIGLIRAQTTEERQYAGKFVLLLSAISVISLILLFWQGRNRQLWALGAAAGIAFAAQVFLKKLGRATRMMAEAVGALALTSTAPAAYCIATGRLDAKAWSLWLVNWLFAADQIHFVWLRIRGARASGWAEKVAVGWSFLAGQIFLIGMLLLARYLGWLPASAFLAFAPILFRGSIWFIKRPEPIAVRRLGWTEMVHALVFGILLTIGFSL